MKNGHSEGNKTRPNAPLWVKLFVGFHLFCITVWCIPSPPQEVMEGKVEPHGTIHFLMWNQQNLKSLEPVHAYLIGTGTWQYWDMFAPDPVDRDYYCRAKVIYKDGSTTMYDYPRMYTMPYGIRYLSERYRKFFERAHLDVNDFIRPDFVQRIAFLNYKDTKNPPVKVELYCYWQDIGAPGTPAPTEYKSEKYYESPVDQERLKRDKELF